jgi:hypothetical protein
MLRVTSPLNRLFLCSTRILNVRHCIQVTPFLSLDLVTSDKIIWALSIMHVAAWQGITALLIVR